MLIKDVAEMSSLDRFLYWIRERHEIFLKKSRGEPKPWTDDKILQTFWFCNPYRENDKTTVWFRTNLRDRLKDSDDVVFITCMFRWFSNPGTIKYLMKGGDGRNMLEEWDVQEVMNRLTWLMSKKITVFTGAYVITAGGSTKNKIARICEDFITPLWENRKQLVDELRKAVDRRMMLKDLHAILSRYQGMGGTGFMSAQVVADLKYTWVGQKAVDWWTWASPGPGSAKGISLVLNEYVEVEDTKSFISKLNKLRDLVNDELDIPDLCAQDLQNCCCEFFKYERSRLEKTTRGKKRRYNGEK